MNTTTSIAVYTCEVSVLEARILSSVDVAGLCLGIVILMTVVASVASILRIRSRFTSNQTQNQQPSKPLPRTAPTASVEKSRTFKS